MSSLNYVRHRCNDVKYPHDGDQYLYTYRGTTSIAYTGIVSIHRTPDGCITVFHLSLNPSLTPRLPRTFCITMHLITEVPSTRLPISSDTFHWRNKTKKKEKRSTNTRVDSSLIFWTLFQYLVAFTKSTHKGIAVLVRISSKSHALY